MGQNQHIFLATSGKEHNNFAVMDIQNPTTPAQVANLKLKFGDGKGGVATVLQGTHVYLAAGDTNRLGPPNFVVLDIQNPTIPAQVANLKLKFGAAKGGVAMVLQGTHVYLVSGDTNRLGPPNWAVLDISGNPQSWDHVCKAEPDCCILS